MKPFYFTFGHYRPNEAICIRAENESAARDIMFLLHGAKWAFCYTQKPDFCPVGVTLWHIRYRARIVRLSQDEHGQFYLWTDYNSERINTVDDLDELFIIARRVVDEDIPA